MPSTRPLPMKASELAALVGGRRSGPDDSFDSVAPLDSVGPGQAAYAERDVPIGCPGVVLTRVEGSGCRVIVEDPKLAFIRLLGVLFPETHSPGGRGLVHESAQVHETAVVYPGAYVGADCRVGAASVLFPGVVLYPGTLVGSNCRLHAGCVLGADGFSYHLSAGGPVKVPQVGRVRVEDDVELGANCCIDRAFLGETVVGPGCKLDNLVHVGHNSHLGRYVLIAAQSGLSGSVRVGDGAVLGGQVGVADHRTIGAGARIGAQSGVGAHVPAGENWLGTPALPARVMRRVYVVCKYLPQVWRVLRRLEQEGEQRGLEDALAVWQGPQERPERKPGSPTG